MVLQAIASTLILLHRSDEAEVALDEALAIAQRCCSPVTLMSLWDAKAMLARRRHHFEDAIVHIHRCRQMAIKGGKQEATLFCDANIATLQWLRGKTQLAYDALAALYPALFAGSPVMAEGCRVTMGLCCLELDQIERAEALLSEPVSGRNPMAVALYRVAQAWMAIRDGEQTIDALLALDTDPTFSNPDIDDEARLLLHKAIAHLQG